MKANGSYILQEKKLGVLLNKEEKLRKNKVKQFNKKLPRISTIKKQNYDCNKKFKFFVIFFQ